MKYNGIELKPIEKVQVFEEGRAMLVWLKTWKEPLEKVVYGIVKRPNLKNVICCPVEYDFCAEIPKPKTRKRTASEKLTYLYKMMNDLCKDEHIISRSKSENRWLEGQAFVIDYLQEDEYKFAILHIDDSMTHFEIPEIEVL